MNDDANQLATISDVLDPDGRIERVELLAPGQFWRALADAKEDNKYGDVIPKGRMHMIKEVKSVDGLAHTVILRGHPLEREGAHYDFLVDNFLQKFESVADPELVRNREIAELQDDIAAQQAKIDRISSDPDYALGLLMAPPEASEGHDEDDAPDELPLAGFDQTVGLPSGTNQHGKLQRFNQAELETVQKQVKNQQILVTARSNLLAEQTETLTELVTMLSPFYTERADAMVATAQSAVAQAEALYAGLQTLELYTGKEVEVVTIAKGKAADPALPITLRQRLLYMDEESLINSVCDGADFNDFKIFAKKLKQDRALLTRIMPESRCVVSMKYRRYDKYYGDPFESARKNAINKESFLLIRDGENIYGVFSPLVMLPRLFPSQEDGERPFRGVDGEAISYDDVQYADARKVFDDTALMYKRVLILLWGLYDHTDILGRFDIEAQYGGHFNLLSAAIQREIFHYVYDDEPALMLGENRPGFGDWIRSMNNHIRSGSKLICRWAKVLDECSAPACFSEVYMHNSGYEQIYTPANDWGVAIVETQDGDLVVRVEVHGYTRRGKSRSFMATVNLKHVHANTLEYLCLDAVVPEELEYYLHSRTERVAYLSYIPLLADALKAVRDQLDEVADIRTAILSALDSGGVADVAQKPVQMAVDRAIRQYRVAHRWQPLPALKTDKHKRAVEKLLDQIWVMLGHGSDRITAAAELCQAEGRQPLRLAITGKNHLILYATPLPQERETRLGEHVWVQRIRLIERKTKLSIDNRRWALLPKKSAGEEALFEWESVNDWIDKYPTDHDFSFYEINQLCNRLTEGLEQLQGLTEPLQESEFTSQLLQANRLLQDFSNKYVRRPYLLLPVAIIRGTHLSTSRLYTLIWKTDIYDYLWLKGSAEGRVKIEDTFRSNYRSPSNSINSIRALQGMGEFGELSLKKTMRLKNLGRDTESTIADHTDLTKGKLNNFCKNYELLWTPDAKQLCNLISILNPVMDEKAKKQLAEFFGLL